MQRCQGRVVCAGTTMSATLVRTENRTVRCVAGTIPMDNETIAAIIAASESGEESFLCIDTVTHEVVELMRSKPHRIPVGTYIIRVPPNVDPSVIVDDMETIEEHINIMKDNT